MLRIFGVCLVDVFGGAALAGLAAWVGWRFFQWVRWPEAGPWAVGALLALIPGAAHRSIVQMALYFLALFTLALIPVGRTWRKREKLLRLFHLHNRAVIRRRPAARPLPRHLV